MTDYLELVDIYTHDTAANLNTDETRAEYSRVLTNMARFVPHNQYGEISRTGLVQWLDGFDVAPGTLNKYIDIVTSFFEWGEMRYQWDSASNPSIGLRRQFPRANKLVAQHNWLPRNVVEHILDLPPANIMDVRDNIVMRLGFTCGLRRAEIVNLKSSNVDLDKGVIDLVGKGSQLATVHLTDPTRQALEEWNKLYQPIPRNTDPVVVRVRHRGFQGGKNALVACWGTPITTSGIYSITQRVSERVGYEFKPHDMRRTFAGLVHKAGGIEAASYALRHRNISTTQRYLEYRQDRGAVAVKDSGFDL